MELVQDFCCALNRVGHFVQRATVAVESFDNQAAKELLLQASAVLHTVTCFSTFIDLHCAALTTCSDALKAAVDLLNSRQTLDVMPGNDTNLSSVSCASNYSVYSEHSKILFEDVIGQEMAKIALMENVIFPLTLCKAESEKIFRGIRAGAGNVLLHGPPGTGKTCLAQAAANEAQAELFAVRPSDILSKYQGESERYISNLFKLARQSTKAIIFFDEFDSIATSRGGANDDGGQCRRLLAELLLQLTDQQQAAKISCRRSPTVLSTRADGERIDGTDSDGDDTYTAASANSDHRVVVIAATNRIQDLDEAILRRFDAKVYVNIPDAQGRQAMLKRFMSGISHSLTDDDISSISQMTEGWSGSEIEMLCRETAMCPLRELFKLGSGADVKSVMALQMKTLSGSDIRTVNEFDFREYCKQISNHEPIILVTNILYHILQKQHEIIYLSNLMTHQLLHN